MSDYNDYKENLVFPPIGSQDDLNEQGRQSDVLIAALEKCEKLEKQLKIAVDCLKNTPMKTCGQTMKKKVLSTLIVYLNHLVTILLKRLLRRLIGVR